jgi:hypothetical protein
MQELGVRKDTSGTGQRDTRVHSIWPGYGPLRLTLPSAVVLQLESEAEDCHAQAREIRQSATVVYRDGSFTSGCRFLAYENPPGLRQVLCSAQLLDTVQAVTELKHGIPVNCAYRFYRPGDYVSLHRDNCKATVTVLIGLSQACARFALSPGMRDPGSSVLAELPGAKPHEHPGMDVTFTVRAAELWALDGHDIPYSVRLPAGSTPVVIATLSYFGL